MKKIYTKVCRRKEAISDMLLVMLGMLGIFGLIVVGLDAFEQMNLATQKARIERTYIAAMETDGYLSPEKQSELIDDLTSLGVTNISLAGTTMQETGYGGIIVLSVTGIMHTDSVVEMTDNWNFIRGGSYEFKIYQKSTAKY